MTNNPPLTYTLGHSDAEIQRLVLQGQFWTTATDQILWSAGIQPGMKVLDAGTGAGDVAFSAARLIGPTGQVLGLDNAERAIGIATVRAAEYGLSNVTFLEQDLNTFEPEYPFDAIIGRLILLHQADPTVTLRRLASYAQPGALLLFQEVDLPPAIPALPPVPLIEQAYAWLRLAMQRAGLDERLGLKLHQIFTGAGLPSPHIQAYTHLDTGTSPIFYHYLSNTIRTLMPIITKTAIAAADEVDIETLAQRLQDQTKSLAATVTSPSLVGAWTHLPSREANHLSP
jgi:ubiquinone/menaquinone biosynthesis C-methylase UbiE